MNRIILYTVLIMVSAVVMAQDIKAITFNIRFANENDGNNKWSLRKESVVNFLAYEEADFVGMQEALLSQIQYVDSALSSYSWIGVGRDDGKEAGEYSPVFYNSRKWKLLEANTFWLSKTPDKPSKSWDAALPRICTYGLFRNKDTGREFYIFNTHYDHIGQKARVNSSKLIVDRMQEIAGFESSILMGDFNAVNTSEVIQVIYNSPLKDAFLSTDIRFGPEGTYTGFDTQRIPERRIDYIYHSPDMSCSKYAVESKLIDGRYLSDHFPVITILENDK